MIDRPSGAHRVLAFVFGLGPRPRSSRTVVSVLGRRPGTELALLCLLAGLAACGGAAKESAPATPAPEFAAPPGGAYPGPDSVPGSLQQFDAAERDVYAALGASPPGEPLAGPVGSPGAQAPTAGVAPAEPRVSGDPCATACTALASMRRSATHLCELAGEDDGRCASAKSRVESATAQVRSRCPACSS